MTPEPTQVLNTFPAELRTLPQWVNWRFEQRKGKKTKVLYDPKTRRAASSTDPSTWATYEQAVASFEEAAKAPNPFDGVGFVFAERDPYCGIDLDWKGAQDEGIPLEAQTLIDRFGSYAELSPSGRGCHIIIRAALPPGGNRRNLSDTVELEVYDSGRYFTVTGRHLGDTPLTVEDRQGELERLHAELFPPKPKTQTQPARPPQRMSLSDAELLERMFRAKNGAVMHRLWNGDAGDYRHPDGSPDRSRADMALCSSLYFWTQGDLARVDALFRQSGLMRDKWDERHYADGSTYGQKTLERLAGGEVYTPKRSRRSQLRSEVGTGDSTERDTKNEGAPTIPENDPEYRDAHGYIEWRRGYEDNKPVYVRLCNFTARIIAQKWLDDGVEVTRTFAVEVTLITGQKQSVDVPAARFAAMGWVTEHCGANAIVEPGNGRAQRLAVAIQRLSQQSQVEKIIPTQHAYSHIGWRKLEEGWHYLSAGGAIGEAGLKTDVEVVPPGNLSHYKLPEPPAGEELHTAVRASLELADLSKGYSSFLLWLATYRAVLDKADFTVFLVGLTGVFKSELVALAQQHFGPAMSAKNLPGSWSSTGNSLEALGFAAKDAMLVVDDFAPEGNRQDIDRYHREAARVLRAQGNNAGRGRARQDGSPRPSKPPRGLIVSTGEDVPRGHSVRARSVIIELRRGDIDSARLTTCQERAESGLYAQALAGYLHWLAPRLDEARAAHRARVRDYRQHLQAPHARSVDSAAELASSAALWLEFAVEVGVITQVEARALWERTWEALQNITGAQTEWQQGADPVERFAALLGAVLESGAAHLVGATDGMEPVEPARWGWRTEVRDSDEFGKTTVYRAGGGKIGWLPADYTTIGVYLEPEATYAAVQELARSQGDGLPMTAQTLWKRLKERGYLTTDTSESRNTHKVRVESGSKNVIHLNPDYLKKVQGLYGAESGKSGNSVENAVPHAKSVFPLLPVFPVAKLGTGQNDHSNQQAETPPESVPTFRGGNKAKNGNTLSPVQNEDNNPVPTFPSNTAHEGSKLSSAKLLTQDYSALESEWENLAGEEDMDVLII